MGNTLRTIAFAASAVTAWPWGASAAPPRRVLVVMDEREQMEALATYLGQKGGLQVTIADQKSMPRDWSRFDAVVGYIHGALHEPTELKIIEYTRGGGRYVCLHHSISSGKAANKHYFDFLGVRLEGTDKAREPATPGDHYAWREGIDLQVVNLNDGHYITSNGVSWPEKARYRPSDSPSVEREYPALTLKHAEAYMNVHFTDGREKTVLLGFKYLDDRNGAVYMQDREGWLKPAGQGWIVYLQMGHSTHEFENPAVAQMVLNAVTWTPPGARDRITSEEFGRLSRYAEANAALVPGRPGETRVVFFGDSITDNWSRDGFGGFFPGKPYVNRGISGQTTSQMLLRFRADVIALQPAVVVILAGTNDIAGNTGPVALDVIEQNLATMAELAKAHGIRIVLASLLPVSDDKRDQGGAPLVRTAARPPASLHALNSWMADYARRNGHVYLDYFTPMADEKGALKADLTDDGLHPNAAGYAVMAPPAERAIAQALGRGAGTGKR